MNMEIDPSEETLDGVQEKIENGALVMYGKQSIGIMGRCLENNKHIILKF